MKGDNQGFVTLAYNPVFHTHIKYIDIQHHYIQGRVTAKRIELFYIPISEMITNKMIKLFI